METVSTEKQDVLKAHENAKRSGKKLLEDLFPKLFVKDITERIKTVKDAFDFIGKPYDPNMKASDQVEAIVEALNEGWEADFSDQNQQKWYIVWKYVTGSGFRLLTVDYEYSDTIVGAPFVFKNANLAKYAATHPPFVEVYNRMLNPKSK